MSIEERVERLERGHRFWKRLAFVLLAALGGVVLMGQAKLKSARFQVLEASLIKAETVIVRDRDEADGHILLAAKGGNPSIQFFDGDEVMQCVITEDQLAFQDKGGAVAVLKDASGGGCLWVGCSDKYGGEVGSIALNAYERWGPAGIQISRYREDEGVNMTLDVTIGESGPEVKGFPSLKCGKE